MRPEERRLELSLGIGRTLGLLRQVRCTERRTVADVIKLRESDLRAIEEGSAEASPVAVVEILAALRFGVEDLMLVLLVTTGERRDMHAELAVRLGECLAFGRGNRDRPLSELIGVNAVEGLRDGMTWSIVRVLGRLWGQVEAGG